MSSARGADRAGDHLDRLPAAARPASQLGEDPLKQEEIARAGRCNGGTAGRPVHRVRGENVTGKARICAHVTLAIEPTSRD
jgi:hypothetical protein